MDGYRFFENQQGRLQVTTSEKLKVARYEQNDFFPLLGFAPAVNTQMEGNGGYAVSWGGWEILHPITVGETLEADMRHIEDPDGLGAFSYQWLIDGIPIYGATSDTYVPKDTDTNRNISLQVSYLDDNKTLETVNTSTFLVVPNILATEA